MASLKNVFVKQNLAHPKEQYSSMTAYGNSKLYNVMTAKVSYFIYNLFSLNMKQ